MSDSSCQLPEPVVLCVGCTQPMCPCVKSNEEEDKICDKCLADEIAHEQLEVRRDQENDWQNEPLTPETTEIEPEEADEEAEESEVAEDSE